MDLVRGRVLDLVLKHDASRIIQTVSLTCLIVYLLST